MSFTKSEEEHEAFELFGELILKLNEEYNQQCPSKSKLLEILKQMMEVVNDG